MSDLRLYSVNWQDGMLIGQQHLRDQERYFEELAQWYGIGAGDRYGLIRKSLSGNPALSMEVLAGGDKIRVTVSRCQAITPDGSYINLIDSESQVIKAETDFVDGQIPVYISCTQSKKREIGSPDPSEDVPRVPYRVMDYELHLGERPGIPEGSLLQVAELLVSGSDVKQSESYYPPCVSVNADEALSKKASDFRTRLETLISLSSKAYVAISSDGSLAAEKSDLQIAFRETVYRLAYHLSSNLDDFALGRNGMHPMQMVIFFKKLFRGLSTVLNLQPALKDYLNEKYFTKEADSQVGQFMSAIDSFLMSNYDHQDLRSQIEMIEAIMTQLRGVLGYLAQAKKEELGRDATAADSMTYAGRTYRIVAAEGSHLEQVGELSYLLVEISDPREVGDAVILMSKDLFDVKEWANMQVRFGVNEARGLGETDPVEVDTTTFGAKVALRPQDMLKSSSVKKITLIFRGASDPQKFADLGKLDLMIYAL